MDWPRYGPENAWPRLAGHTDSLPDLVGPLDGSARLTVFTEGNHFPALLPILFEDFPTWCAEHGRVGITAEDILAITLPQYLLAGALAAGGLVLGNAVLPLAPDGPVFPDIVMAGTEALESLAKKGLVRGEATVFARHLGPTLLLRRGAGLEGLVLTELAARRPRLVLATEAEAGARSQYLAALGALAGPDNRSALLANEVGVFPGRLGIQHRDVPYALTQGLADVGIIFRHLALYFAGAFPETLAYAPIPGAAAFGREIALASSARPDTPARAAFLEFFLEPARARYPTYGFASATEFAYGRKMMLGGD
jgi:hypothetical protein